MNLLQSPLPGQSLTNDPENPKPFEQATEFTRVEDAQEYLFDSMMSPDTIPALIETIRQQVPLSMIAQVLLFAGFAKGKWNPDLYLLLIEPTIYILIFIAEQAGINYVLEPDQNDEALGLVGEHQLLANGGALAKMFNIDPTKAANELPEEIINKVGSKVFDATASAMPQGGNESLLGGMPSGE